MRTIENIIIHIRKIFSKRRQPSASIDPFPWLQLNDRKAVDLEEKKKKIKNSHFQRQLRRFYYTKNQKPYTDILKKIIREKNLPL